MHIHIQAYTSPKKITDCLIYCILSNREVINCHKFISVVVIELSIICLNTGPEDRLTDEGRQTKTDHNSSEPLAQVS